MQPSRWLSRSVRVSAALSSALCVAAAKCSSLWGRKQPQRLQPHRPSGGLPACLWPLCGGEGMLLSTVCGFGVDGVCFVAHHTTGGVLRRPKPEIFSTSTCLFRPTVVFCHTHTLTQTEPYNALPVSTFAAMSAHPLLQCCAPGAPRCAEPRRAVHIVQRCATCGCPALPPSFPVDPLHPRGSSCPADPPSLCPPSEYSPRR